MNVVTASLLPEDKPRRHEEADLQRQVVQFLRIALPSDAVCFHVPNGGQRHPKAAARLTGLGVVAGIPDLCVIHRGRAYFVELKVRGSLSAAQRQMLDKLIVCGADVVCCRSLDCVEGALRECGIPLRASAAAVASRRRIYSLERERLV